MIHLDSQLMVWQSCHIYMNEIDMQNAQPGLAYESIKQVYTNVGVQTDITVVSYKLYKCLLLRMQMIRYSQAPSEAIPMFSC